MVISQQVTEERGFTHVVTALKNNGVGIQMGFVSEWGAKLCAKRLEEKGYYDAVSIAETAH